MSRLPAVTWRSCSKNIDNHCKLSEMNSRVPECDIITLTPKSITNVSGVASFPGHLHLQFLILQAIKNWRCRRPGNEATAINEPGWEHSWSPKKEATVLTLTPTEMLFWLCKMAAKCGSIWKSPEM